MSPVPCPARTQYKCLALGWYCQWQLTTCEGDTRNEVDICLSLSSLSGKVFNIYFYYKSLTVGFTRLFHFNYIQTKYGMICKVCLYNLIYKVIGKTKTYFNKLLVDLDLTEVINWISEEGFLLNPVPPYKMSTIINFNS